MAVPNFDLNFTPNQLDEMEEPGDRFARLDEDEVNRIEDGRVEVTTKRATKWGVKILKDWLKERTLNEDFEQLPPDALDDLLRQFYGEARTRSGQRYGKSAMSGLRSAINRHLTGHPHNRRLNIITDREFKKSNNMFLGLIKDLKKEGLDRTKHHTPISDADLEKVHTSGALTNDTPLGLVRKVWFSVTLYFGRRGSEGQRNLTEESFRLGKDDVGREFVEMNINEKEKNHPGAVTDGQHKQSRMYDIPEDASRCPVTAFKKYLQKRNPKNEAFYQRPLQFDPARERAVWFADAPIGVKRLQSMMRDISQAANLSMTYTNHCLRATTCTILDQAGHSVHQIMAVTDHKRQLSETLSSKLSTNMAARVAVGPRPNSNTSNNNINSCNNNTSATIDEGLGLHSNMTEPNVTGDSALYSHESQPQRQSQMMSLSFQKQDSLSSMFHGCTFNAPVNINYR